MKVRMGFVSNSSSSSFLIYGTVVRAKDLPATNDGVSEYEAWDRLVQSTDLKHYNPGYDGTHYIGLSWDAVKDDETGKQFKERVEALIEKVLGKKVPCDTLEEAWHD